MHLVQKMTTQEMTLRSVVGFEGGITDGLKCLCEQDVLIYALGSTIVLRHPKPVASQIFLRGHTDKVVFSFPSKFLTSQVSCIALSPSGKLLASGQLAHMGFTAQVVLWDLENKKPIHQMELHKVDLVVHWQKATCAIGKSSNFGYLVRRCLFGLVGRRR